jgi:hypothetical protein
MWGKVGQSPKLSCLITWAGNELQSSRIDDDDADDDADDDDDADEDDDLPQNL